MTRLRRASALAVIAALAAAPLAGTAFAQEDQPSAKEMKGPPNANGYGKEKMGDTVVKDEKAPSAKDMKGPPNANGYEKK